MANIREKFDSKYKWNVKDLYENDKLCIEDLKIIENKISDIKKYEGKILDNANNLLNLLKLDTELSKKLERAYIYAHINNDADTLDTNYQELYGKAKNIYTKYMENMIKQGKEKGYTLISFMGP